MTGIRREIRRALYHSHKFDLGCPRDGECLIFKALKVTKPCGPENSCKHFFGPVEPEPHPVALARIRFLTRLESMVNVGCKFQVNDLDGQTWSELIMLAIERQRVQDKLAKGREAQREKPPEPEEKKAFETARKELGLPPVGGAIFPSRTPMK